MNLQTGRIFFIGLFSTLVFLGQPRLESQPKSSDLHPIIDDTGFLFGATSAGHWIKSSHTVRCLRGTETYTAYSQSRKLGDAPGSKAESAGDPCPDQQSIPAHLPSATVIAIAAPWNALPRPAKFEKSSQPLYNNIVAQELTRRGLRNPIVHIDQIVRCDLDGAGIDTVLISAHHLQEFSPGSGHIHAGDYTIILARQIVHGHVKTFLLDGDVYPKHRDSMWMTYHISGVYDFLGDGHMEPVVSWRYYEGSGNDICVLRNGISTVALSTGCGA